MAAKPTILKQYKKRPGLSAAAKKLGCTYSHLRRVVDGERSSPALLKKLCQLIGQRRVMNKISRQVKQIDRLTARYYSQRSQRNQTESPATGERSNRT